MAKRTTIYAVFYRYLQAAINTDNIVPVINLYDFNRKRLETRCADRKANGEAMSDEWITRLTVEMYRERLMKAVFRFLWNCCRERSPMTAQNGRCLNVPGCPCARCTAGEYGPMGASKIDPKTLMRGKLIQLEGKRPPHRSLIYNQFQAVEFAGMPIEGQRFYFCTDAHPDAVGTSAVKDFTRMEWRGGGWVEFKTRNSMYRLEWGVQQGYVPPLPEVSPS